MEKANSENHDLLDIQDEVDKLTTQLGAIIGLLASDGLVETINENIVRSNLWIAQDLVKSLSKNHKSVWNKLNEVNAAY